MLLGHAESHHRAAGARDYVTTRFVTEDLVARVQRRVRPRQRIDALKAAVRGRRDQLASAPR
jgi:DNA-binding response OmpR family regulator